MATAPTNTAAKIAKLRKMAEDKSLPQDVRNTYLDEAVKLLREARKLIHTTLDIDALHDWACESDGDELALDDSMYSLRGRIDAALKEHETPVEWVCPRLGLTHFASVGNASVSVSKQIGNDYWWWTINCIVLGPTEGWAKTEEEAKAAAIAAARSLS